MGTFKLVAWYYEDASSVPRTVLSQMVTVTTYVAVATGKIHLVKIRDPE